jgi:hypothetical protein
VKWLSAKRDEMAGRFSIPGMNPFEETADFFFVIDSFDELPAVLDCVSPTI